MTTTDREPTLAAGPEGGGLLRARQPNGHARVGFIELFFDLVFVFAVTQLAHSLIKHFSPLGAVQTLLLFMAVWWAWIDTSWVTNWLDPEKRPVRLMLLVLMLAGLVMSTSIPDAFGDRGIYFAAAYAFIQVGRSLFTLYALRGRSPANYRNFQRITVWFVLFSGFWIAGGLAEGDLRFALWAIAVAIETIAPTTGFYVPVLGRSTTIDLRVDGSHMAERCALFIIIALGESILVTGATFSGLAWTWTDMAAFLVAFLGSVALWWIYFDGEQGRGSIRIAHSADPARLARLAYSFLHLPIVAGIILAAVGDELILAHSTGHAGPGIAAAILGGPALYLLGIALFKRAITGRWALSYPTGIALLFIVLVPAETVSPLAIGAAAVVILAMVGAWESLSSGMLASRRVR